MAKRTKINSLPIIAADETIHDIQDDLSSSDKDELPDPSELNRIVIEEDIVGSKAAIVYKENLSQLAALVQVPVKHCAHTVTTGGLCQSLPPFTPVVKQQRSAFVVQWVTVMTSSS